MDIKTWILNKLVAPAVPILKQGVYVLDIVVAKIDSALKALETLGIKIDGTILSSIQNALSAITVVRAAIVRVLAFVGETFGISKQSNEALAQVDLDAEIERLKQLI